MSAPTATVGIITLPGFNEIDSFVAARMIDSAPGLRVELFGPDGTAVSMAGVEVATPGDWTDLGDCAAVVIGSGALTFEHIENAPMIDEIRDNLAPEQLVGSQCSGAAILHRLGRLTSAARRSDVQGRNAEIGEGEDGDGGSGGEGPGDEIVVCTDRLTAPKLEALGVKISIEAFRSHGTTASAGGCLSSTYLAYWIIERLAGREAADHALDRVVPIGEEADYQSRVDRLIPSRALKV